MTLIIGEWVAKITSECSEGHHAVLSRWKRRVNEHWFVPYWCVCSECIEPTKGNIWLEITTRIASFEGGSRIRISPSHSYWRLRNVLTSRNYMGPLIWFLIWETFNLCIRDEFKWYQAQSVVFFFKIKEFQTILNP